MWKRVLITKFNFFVRFPVLALIPGENFMKLLTKMALIQILPDWKGNLLIYQPALP